MIIPACGVPKRIFGTHHERMVIVCVEKHKERIIEFWDTQTNQIYKAVIFQNISDIHYVSISKDKKYFSIGSYYCNKPRIVWYEFSSSDVCLGDTLSGLIVSDYGDIHAMSPDGRRIAYIEKVDGVQSLKEVDLLGGEILKRKPCEYRPEFIEYDKSGENIVFSYFGKTSDANASDESGYVGGSAIQSLTSSPSMGYNFFQWYQTAFVDGAYYFINEFTHDIERMIIELLQYEAEGMPTKIHSNSEIFRTQAIRNKNEGTSE